MTRKPTAPAASRGAFSERLRAEMLAAGKVRDVDGAVVPDEDALMQVAHVARGSARGYLAGTVTPSTRVLLAICEWLDLSPPWLRAGIGPKYRGPNYGLSLEEKMVLAYFRVAPSTGKAFMLRAGRRAVTMREDATPGRRGRKRD